MASKQMLAVLAVFAAATVLPSAMGMDIAVGDGSGWKPDFNYTAWAEGKDFRVGDYLVFDYPKGAHDVIPVGGDEFKACKANVTRIPFISGNDRILLKAEGRKWYICGFSDHCSRGQRLVISVQAPLSPVPAPAPATSSPAPAPATSSPAPSPAISSPAPAPATSSPAPSPATSSPAPAPATSSPAPAPATSSPDPAPAPVTSSPAPAPATSSPDPAPAPSSPDPAPAPSSATGHYAFQMLLQAAATAVAAMIVMA